MMVTIARPGPPPPRLDPRGVAHTPLAALAAAPPAVRAGGGVATPGAGPAAHRHAGAVNQSEVSVRIIDQSEVTD